MAKTSVARCVTVRQIRARLKLTQRTFAELLGVSVPAVQRWEAGTETPTSTAGVILRHAMHRAAMRRGGPSRDAVEAIHELLEAGKPVAALAAYLVEIT